MVDDVEFALTSGRITRTVMRKGDVVLRSVCENGPFSHTVMQWLERKNLLLAPRFLGLDAQGREILSFLRGESPDNLGWFTDDQCLQAVRIIRTLHQALEDFPMCPPGQTVCHNDLSPCNFIFRDDLPYGVIDWDSVAFGHPLDDLAYAVWMWLDIGNDNINPRDSARRMRLMLDEYKVGVCQGFCSRILGQIERVASGKYPTEKQAQATGAWAKACSRWLQANIVDFEREF